MTEHQEAAMNDDHHKVLHQTRWRRNGRSRQQADSAGAESISGAKAHYDTAGRTKKICALYVIFQSRFSR